jgi:hypothetical protein
MIMAAGIIVPTAQEYLAAQLLLSCPRWRGFRWLADVLVCQHFCGARGRTPHTKRIGIGDPPPYQRMIQIECRNRNRHSASSPDWDDLSMGKADILVGRNPRGFDKFIVENQDFRSTKAGHYVNVIILHSNYGYRILAFARMTTLGFCSTIIKCHPRAGGDPDIVLPCPNIYAIILHDIIEYWILAFARMAWISTSS